MAVHPRFLPPEERARNLARMLANPDPGPFMTTGRKTATWKGEDLLEVMKRFIFRRPSCLRAPSDES